MNQKGYLSIILAALLHDIGKFWQRAGKSGSHQEAGAAFINDFQHLFPYDYLDDLRDAIGNHHKLPVHKEIEKIVKIADWLASYERISEHIERQDPEKTPLVPITSKIQLLYNSPKKKYLLKLKELCLERENIFPEENVIVSQADYHNLWTRFFNELRKLTVIDNSLKFVSLLSLLRKYTSFIPSATPWEEDEEFKTFPDISLFDHLKVTTAIASCLAHLLPGDIDAIYSKKSECEDKNICLMVRGDISGIQKFIYRITAPEAEAKGTAKRLRGRSFYLSVLADVIADWIIRKLNLTIANILFCSGGRFDILVPITNWTDKMNEKLLECEAELEKWLLENFYGEVGVQIAKTLITPRDFADMKSANNRLNDILAEKKRKKFHRFFKEENFFIPMNIYHVCSVCQLEPLNDPGVCNVCKRHKDIGQKIPETSHIAYCYGNPNGLFQADFDFNSPFGVYIGLLNEKKVRELVGSINPGKREIVLYRLNSTDFLYDDSAADVSFSFRFLGNEAPIALENIPATNGEEPTKKGDVLSFENIAGLSEGTKLLGILKGDVDYLGLIFGEGIEPRSISRISTFSNSLDIFFAGWLNIICREVSQKWKDELKNKSDPKHNWVDNLFYIVYSGGDDLLIIGPWNQVIEVAQRLYEDFRFFTCHNRNITLSAGITCVKPHFPVQRFAHLVNEDLEKSKNDADEPGKAGLKEKNRITLFGETVEWEDGNNPEKSLKELTAFAKRLAAQVENTDSPLPRGFIHFLRRLEEYFYKRGSLMWVPKFFYSLKRRVKKEVMENLDLQSKVPAVMGKMKIPVSYVSLITRKE
ncbi:MAG: type III-A CRISPR-associated protein Cas10/Csm1 [Nitrospirota bacterium]